MKRTRKVPVACMQCKRAHLSCSDVRPCERCVAKHIGHLCDDHSLRPQINTFTEEEMQTISDILGTDGFDVMKAPDEFDFLQASIELDYSSIFLQDAETFLKNKNTTPVSPSITPTAKRPIVRVPSSSTSTSPSSTVSTTTLGATNNSTPNTPTCPYVANNPAPHMVHGIIVNQPPTTFRPATAISGPAPLPTSTQTNRLKNIAFVHNPDDALTHFYNNNFSTSTTSSPPTSTTTPSTPVVGPSSDPELREAISNALTLRTEELQLKVAQLEETQAKLQRAIADKDQQLEEMQLRQRQNSAKLKILVQCRVVPQALDLSLVGRSKEYGIMTALYDINSGFVLDYNKNFAKMLTDVFGPNFDVQRVKMPPGPMECGVQTLVNMMVKDYFKESLEKYTYIKLPSGEKLPFLFSLSIQCWERPAGPLINFTYWM